MQKGKVELRFEEFKNPETDRMPGTPGLKVFNVPDKFLTPIKEDVIFDYNEFEHFMQTNMPSEMYERFSEHCYKVEDDVLILFM